jgi:hypothetical protein
MGIGPATEQKRVPREGVCRYGFMVRIRTAQDRESLGQRDVLMTSRSVRPGSGGGGTCRYLVGSDPVPQIHLNGVGSGGTGARRLASPHSPLRPR